MLELDRLEQNTVGVDPAAWQEEFNIVNDNLRVAQLRVDAAKAATSSLFGKVVLQCKDDFEDVLDRIMGVHQPEKAPSEQASYTEHPLSHPCT